MKVVIGAFAAVVLLLLLSLPGFTQDVPSPPIHVDTNEMAWAPSDPEGFPKGRTRKLLHMNEINGVGVGLMRHPKGYIEPVHYHTTAGHYIYMLEGRMLFEGVEAKPGDFFYTPPYHAHGPLEMLEETVFLLWTDGPLDVHLGTPPRQVE